MTSKPPLHRLSDVLARNSKRSLERNAADMVAAATTLPPEVMESRFLRNCHLISPKSLHLLTDESTFARFQTFAVYKPAFCPMRRAEARDNYHKVSVESFIEAALKSRSIAPVMHRTLTPQQVKVRVLNDVDTLASGPVVVSVADNYSFSTTLQDFTMQYDVLVAGHLPVKGPKDISPELLFPTRSLAAKGSASESVPQCQYEVKQNAYYAIHPVSLLHITIARPPTPLPPAMNEYVRGHLKTFILGDPVAMGEIFAAQSGKAKKKENSGKESLSASALSMLSVRGDCDFPRVFVHLREVRINAKDSTTEESTASTVLTFHCNKCFDPLLQPARVYSLKNRALKLLDGSWTPDAEFL